MKLKVLLDSIPNDTIVCVESNSKIIIAKNCKFVKDWLNYHTDERANKKVIRVYPEYHKLVMKMGITIEI